MSELAAHRDHIFAVAYRMLGTIADAEDVVQDTWLRWLRRDAHADIHSPRAFLTTTATRLSIDRLRALKLERRHYEGMWLPEPLVELGLNPRTPYAKTEMTASLSPAFLVLLETLAPVERAAFLLRDIFELEYGEVGEIIEKSEANCRQICKRARERVRSAPRFEPKPDEARALALRFFAAAAAGDLDGLIALLREDIVAWSDHGGKASAARNTITGRDRVGRYLIGSAVKFASGLRPEFATVGGVPGIVLYDGPAVHAVLFIESYDGLVARFGTIRNPEKLAHVPPPSA